jgi:ApeA N-terminal domain 1
VRGVDALGLFWVEGHEDDALSGRVIFSPSDRIKLELVGRFDNEVDGFHIHGWVGGDKITLSDCWEAGERHPLPGVAAQEFGANRMFTGHHLASDDLRFQSADCEVSHLADWLDRPGWTESQADKRRQREIHFSLTADMKHRFSSGTVGIVFEENHEWHEVHGVTLRQRPMFRIEYDTMQSFDTIRRDIGRLQSLLILCLDSYAEIDRLLVRRPDVHEHSLSGDDMGVEKNIEVGAQPLRHLSEADRQPISRYRMLLTFDQLGGIDLVANWLDQSQRIQRVLDYMISTQHRPMYMENRFFNIVGAAEAFQRITDPTSLFPQSQFEELYRKYVEITPDEHREWLRGKIGYAIEPSLRSRLLRLARQSNEATATVTGTTSSKRQDWAWTVATLRNWLAHVHVNAAEISGADMRALSDSVYSVLRMCMLLDCGLDPSILPTLRESRAHALRTEIDSVVARVREVLVGFSADGPP